MIAMGDPDAYKEFFETISPENAERLYMEASSDVRFNEEFRRFAATYAAMDSGSAADVLTNLLNTDAALLIGILRNMSTDNRAAIFDEMDDTVAARITRLLQPERVELPAPTAPPIPVPEPVAITAAEETEIPETTELETELELETEPEV
jgi:hypothetical protein